MRAWIIEGYRDVVYKISQRQREDLPLRFLGVAALSQGMFYCYSSLATALKSANTFRGFPLLFCGPLLGSIIDASSPGILFPFIWFLNFSLSTANFSLSTSCGSVLKHAIINFLHLSSLLRLKLIREFWKSSSEMTSGLITSSSLSYVLSAFEECSSDSAKFPLWNMMRDVISSIQAFLQSSLSLLLIVDMRVGLEKTLCNPSKGETLLAQIDCRYSVSLRQASLMTVQGLSPATSFLSSNLNLVQGMQMNLFLCWTKLWISKALSWNLSRVISTSSLYLPLSSMPTFSSRQKIWYFLLRQRDPKAYWSSNFGSQHTSFAFFSRGTWKYDRQFRDISTMNSFRRMIYRGRVSSSLQREALMNRIRELEDSNMVLTSETSSQMLMGAIFSANWLKKMSSILILQIFRSSLRLSMNSPFSLDRHFVGSYSSFHNSAAPFCIYATSTFDILESRMTNSLVVGPVLAHFSIDILLLLFLNFSTTSSILFARFVKLATLGQKTLNVFTYFTILVKFQSTMLNLLSEIKS